VRLLLEQIRASLNANLYYLSLFASLTVPDICGALESENGYATPDRYRAWFNKYVAPRYTLAGSAERHLQELPDDVREMLARNTEQLFTAQDCWNFRCSVLHQGSSQHQGGRYSRILFVEPDTTTSTLHLNVFNNALNIDVKIFCNDMIEGAERWLDQVEETERYQTNYERFMRRYPDGMPPYIVGYPVIG
jgi:hypothetical protein